MSVVYSWTVKEKKKRQKKSEIFLMVCLELLFYFPLFKVWLFVSVLRAYSWTTPNHPEWWEDDNGVQQIKRTMKKSRRMNEWKKNEFSQYAESSMPFLFIFYHHHHYHHYYYYFYFYLLFNLYDSLFIILRHIYRMLVQHILDVIGPVPVQPKIYYKYLSNACNWRFRHFHVNLWLSFYHPHAIEAKKYVF